MPDPGIKTVVIHLDGQGKGYSIHGDKVQPGERFRLVVEVMKPDRPITAETSPGKYGLAPYRLVDNTVTKHDDPLWAGGKYVGEARH